MSQTITPPTLILIPPGYSVDGYIAPEPGIHGGLYVNYRPWNSKDASVLADMISNSAEPHSVVASTLAESINKWSAVTPNSKPVPIEPENVTRLAPKLFDKLWGLVQCYRASDPIPVEYLQKPESAS